MGLGWLGAWGLRGLRFEIESEGRTRRLALSASQVVWLGCAADCHVVLDAPGVAPKHLSVFVRGGELFVRDHSAHGTRVEGQRLRLALRRVAAPARLELGPYRVRVSLGPAWLGLASLGMPGAGGLPAAREASTPRPGRFRGLGSLVRPVQPWWLAAAAAAIALGLARALLWPSPRPPVAAAACAVERTDPGFVLFARGTARFDAARGSGAGAAASAPVPHGAAAPSVLRAVQLLREGRKLEALSQYKALSARDDSPAPLAVVAGLLEYELACPR